MPETVQKRILITDPINNPPVVRFRNRRWAEFIRRFPDVELWHVLDLGGTLEHWLQAPFQPKRLTIVNPALNIDYFPESRAFLNTRQKLMRPGVHRENDVLVAGDACEFADIPNQYYDLVYSNSVIAHLGGHNRRWAFAKNVKEFSDNYWVQTPWRYFPFDPCFFFPYAPSLPVPIRARVARYWPLGHRHAPNMPDAMENALSLEPLTRSELSYYFQDAEAIWAETFLGIPKSYVAVRGGIL